MNDRSLSVAGKIAANQVQRSSLCSGARSVATVGEFNLVFVQYETRTRMLVSYKAENWPKLIERDV